MKPDRKQGLSARRRRLLLASEFSLILLGPMSLAQTPGEPPSSPEAKPNQELQVNWLYGAFVPKDVPLQSLSNHQRFQLVLRQSFTTPGVYVKTALFSLADQAGTLLWNGVVGLAAMANDSVRVTDKLDEREHFLENPTAGVASLRPLIGSTPKQ